MVTQGKHGPNRFDNYIIVHETVMEHALRSGFVTADELVFQPIYGQILLEGAIHCLGNIYITVRKSIEILEGEGADALVQTRSYSYNVALKNRGNIFRYDSPHLDHNKEHHVHRYDILHGDREGVLAFLPLEQERPTLGDVIEEARQWYYAHLDELDD